MDGLFSDSKLRTRQLQSVVAGPVIIRAINPFGPKRSKKAHESFTALDPISPSRVFAFRRLFHDCTGVPKTNAGLQAADLFD